MEGLLAGGHQSRNLRACTCKHTGGLQQQGPDQLQCKCMGNRNRGHTHPYGYAPWRGYVRRLAIAHLPCPGVEATDGRQKHARVPFPIGYHTPAPALADACLARQLAIACLRPNLPRGSDCMDPSSKPHVLLQALWNFQGSHVSFKQANHPLMHAAAPTQPVAQTDGAAKPDFQE